jgi:hypothetical protein
MLSNFSDNLQQTNTKHKELRLKIRINSMLAIYGGISIYRFFPEANSLAAGLGSFLQQGTFLINVVLASGQ